MEKKKFKLMYLKLQITALLGAFVCWYFGALEVLKWYDYFCYAYMAFMFGFFRLNIDNVDERFFGIACWLAILSAEASLLLGVDMWYHPVIAACVVSLYFLLRAYIYAKHLNVDMMLRSAFWLTVINYILFGLIKVAGAKIFG